MKRLLTILLLLVLALSLAACGGENKKAKYAAEFNEEVTQGFGQAVETLATDPTADHVHRAAGDLRRLSTNLRALKAPDAETKADTVRLGRALRDYADTLDSAANGSVSDLTLRTKLTSETVKTIIDDINEGLK